ncbi:hypothetical protein [Nocardioides sp.]|uniref:arsenate reductase/protein-tyrosine-phosphatase family protein n=1 Tax=Nocardioides sp. TaxID=35761 RepID=UPI002ED9BF57
MTFRILVVCTANLCRSPLVAALLAHDLDPTGGGRPVAVSSAGINALSGERACPEMAQLVAAHWLPVARLAEHRAVQLTLEQVAVADLILTADRRARSEVLKMAPLAAPHTFTVREAAALVTRTDPRTCGASTEDRLWSCVATMHAHRGLTDLPRTRHVLALPTALRPLSIHDHDLPDAHQRDLAPHRVVLRLATSAAGRLGASLSACVTSGVG